MASFKGWLRQGMVCLFLLAGFALQAEELIYRVDIRDDIGPKTWRLARRAFAEAEQAGADKVIVNMNTYGGMVVYADSLRSLILNCAVPVWVFIDNNAASAGALIAIACDKIYMREGANIGAATVVNASGEAMPDKYQSYMRSMIRATAQAHGKDTIVVGRDTVYRWKRDPRIAEAMVDERIAIEGVTDSGRIVTFTPHEAMHYGYCDGIADNIAGVIAAEGIRNYTLKSYEPTVADKIIGFLVSPVLQGLLIMVIIGGIYFELQSPGIGFPLIAAIVACLLYFAPLYLEGFVGHWEIVAFIAGVVLLLLEIFVIPGFGVAGISGAVLILVSLVFAGIDRIPLDFWSEFAGFVLNSLFLVVTCSLVALGGSMWLGAKLFGTRRWAFALHAEQRKEDGYVGVDMDGLQVVGKEGRAVTDLRPSGKVEVDGEVYDAVSSLGDYIVKGMAVTVVKYQGGQIYVEATGSEK